MSNATRGTVLAGRYRLEDRYHANTDSSVWRAADLTLDRPVTVRVMRPGHPYSADVADAARRAALIDDPRLVRVLDVGTHEDITFMVSADVDGDSLATLIERAPLDPPVVRRIVGEVAQGLRGAAARGLHHLRLTPRSVIITYDNTIKISGVAVEAASAGIDPKVAATASRMDALSLIGLLYAGLTGRWPLDDTGFAPAPRANDGGPIAPSELIPDIPGDLNRLCLLTLGPLDSGPHTPAEVVGALSPWPSADEAPLRSASRPRRPVAPATPNPALVMRGRPPRGQTPASGFRPGGPVSPIGSSAGQGASGPVGSGASARDASAWAPAGGESLFDPRRRDREVDPDATLPPSAVPPELFSQVRSAGNPSGQPPVNRGSRPQAWPSGSPPERPSAAPPENAAPAARPERRTASLFPTPSVAITGSMPLPPRAQGGDRTDAMFGNPPAGEEAAPETARNSQPIQPVQPVQPVGGNRTDGARPAPRKVTAAPQVPQGPGSPQRPRSPQNQPRPQAPQRPQNRPQGAEPARPMSPPVRRTASIFPTPSVAMTGSMPLPPRPKGGDRTDALFGIEPAANTDLTPAPLREARRAQQNASAPEPVRQPRQPQQPQQTQQPPRPPQPPTVRAAQFAQPPRSAGSPDQPRPNLLDSGPIPTAAAARTAAGLRAGRPTSRPLADVPGSGSPNLMARPITPDPGPGASPSFFASASTAGRPGAGRPGSDTPDSEVAPGDTWGEHSAMGSQPSAGPGRHRGPADGRASAAAASRLPWEQGWSHNPHSNEPPSPLESSGPFPIVIPPEAPSKGQSRKVLFGIVGVFLVLLLVAAWQLRGVVLDSDDDSVAVRETGPLITTQPANTVEPPPSPGASAEAKASVTAEPVEKIVEPVKIRTATAIDPQGDGDENSADAPRAVDGKKGTEWESNWYGNAKFGGLKKGLGLAIELRRAAAVSSAEIDVAGTGGRVQLRSADGPDYDGSKLIGSGKLGDGKITVDPDDDVDEAKYVIVWFTELPSIEGEYRLNVSEVRLT
ncbi:hypothetical protein GCM10022223_25610 [Kineosporia mesophila]|uniref:Protein kinase domain-containing protein n=1 Tax=Kineosporia mesophila TaxID=566012 RepID=A0ABP6ZH31_9ACTN|nr:protein kinase family protein [Kineosporia mesophila]MCD5350554.1 hypothetical protein [Kineosporia mesophila]